MFKCVLRSSDELTTIDVSHVDAANRSRAQWIADNIDKSLIDVAKKRKGFRRKSAFAYILSAALSASVTVFLGLNLEYLNDSLKCAALILSSIVTIIGILEPFFNWRILWVEHEEAKYRLHRLRNRFEYEVQRGDITTQQLDEFATEHQNIWDILSTRWLSARRATDKQAHEDKRNEISQ